MNVSVTDPALARHMWSLYEPIHVVTYFTPQARSAFEDAGLRGFWRGYFAGRAAPLGAVEAAPVVASFFSFAPQMVARAVPDVWTRISPADALHVRMAGAVAALGSMLTDVDAVSRAEIADLLGAATANVDCAGRVLGAANAALARTTGDWPRIWQATTILREHRGDGHVAAQVAADVSGCEALVWRASYDLVRDHLQPNRGWTDDEWVAAHARLVDRGWLDAEGKPTADGEAHHDAIETATDRAALAPWRQLGAAGTQRLIELLTPLARVLAAPLVDFNPIGLPQP
ncbi:MAG: SCO6745 family protein [Actinomycetes bacterium]